MAIWDGGKPDARRSGLSAPRQRLLHLLQEIWFGEVRNLVVRRGEPGFDPPPEAVRDIVLGREEALPPSLGRSDFALRREHRDLFERFDREIDADVERIVVQAGLPIRIRLKVSRAS